MFPSSDTQIQSCNQQLLGHAQSVLHGQDEVESRHQQVGLHKRTTSNSKTVQLFDWEFGNRWNDLSNSCPSDNTVTIFENGKDSRSMFKFNSFRFQRLEKVSTVWLHCEVHVCDGERLVCQPVSAKPLRCSILKAHTSFCYHIPLFHCSASQLFSCIFYKNVMVCVWKPGLLCCLFCLLFHLLKSPCSARSLSSEAEPSGGILSAEFHVKGTVRHVACAHCGKRTLRYLTCLSR